MSRKFLNSQYIRRLQRKMPNRIDISGNKYNRLWVLSYSHTSKGIAFWLCRCDCGKETIVDGRNLKSGHTKSCGCLSVEQRPLNNLKHGGVTNGGMSAEYECWCGIKKRCYNENSDNYNLYGGRGIKMCDRWLSSFGNFLADMGNKPTPKHSIDRIDVNGDYEPSNCRWATQKEQCRNLRRNRIIEFNGESKTLIEWAEETGMNRDAIILRAERGLPLEHERLSYKVVVNLNTGIFYSSIAEAARSSHYKHESLLRYLSGKVKNKTPFLVV